MLLRSPTSRALRTMDRFLDLLDKMEREYRPGENPNMRWVLREQKILREWQRKLREARGTEDINALWQDFQSASQLIDCAIDDGLGRRHQSLEARLWRDMTDVVAEARRRRQ